MLFTVIIPTCNRVQMLKSCLDLLAPEIQNFRKDEYEIIVTDDSKENTTKQLIEENYKGVKWVAGPKKGPAANRNNGAKFALGTWYIFIDDDCIPGNNIIKSYEHAIMTFPGKTVFEGRIEPDNWKLLEKDLSECPVNTDGNNFWSANICIKATLFNNIQGFDERYFLAAQEDQQFKIDVENATGSKIMFVSNAMVIHPVRFTTIQKQISMISPASKNFILYATKNRKLLKYNGILSFSTNQFRFHFQRSISFLKQRKIKSLIISMAWLFYGVPLNILNFSKMTREKVS